MKIGLVSFAWPQKYKEYVARGITSKQEYCKKHGYDFLDDTDGLLIGEDGRSPHWSKLLLLRKYSDQGYDFLVWMDADTIIINFNQTLEQLWVDSGMDEAHEMLFTRDPRGSINTGIFFMRCSKWAKSFLESAYTNVLSHYAWHDQAAIIDLYRNNFSGAKSKIHIENRTWKFNSYPSEKNTGENKNIPEIGVYHQGDFLVHFLGMNDGRLEKAMNSFDSLQYKKRENSFTNGFTREHWMNVYGQDRGLTHIPLKK
jgi:hypothetical protein